MKSAIVTLLILAIVIGYCVGYLSRPRLYKLPIAAYMGWSCYPIAASLEHGEGMDYADSVSTITLSCVSKSALSPK